MRHTPAVDVGCGGLGRLGRLRVGGVVQELVAVIAAADRDDLHDVAEPGRMRGGDQARRMLGLAGARMVCARAAQRGQHALARQDQTAGGEQVGRVGRPPSGPGPAAHHQTHPGDRVGQIGEVRRVSDGPVRPGGGSDRVQQANVAVEVGDGLMSIGVDPTSRRANRDPKPAPPSASGQSSSRSSRRHTVIGTTAAGGDSPTGAAPFARAGPVRRRDLKE